MERVVCLLIVLCLNSLARSEFIFWAELSTQNYILFHQNESISPAMVQSKDVYEEYVCDIYYDEKDLLYLKKTDLGLIDDDMSKDLKLRFLNKHKEKLLSCFNTLDVKIKDTVEADFLKAKSATYLKILPLRFSISFSNDRALIYYLRKN